MKLSIKGIKPTTNLNFPFEITFQTMLTPKEMETIMQKTLKNEERGYIHMQIE